MKTKIFTVLTLLLAVYSCKKDNNIETVPYPTNGLDSYFNLDDNLKDQRGYMADGQATGQPQFVPGKLGKAIFLDANERIVFAPKNSSTRSSVSFACWFNTNQISTEAFITLNTNSGSSVFLTTLDLNYISFGISGNPTVFANVLVTKGQWTHLAATYDDTGIKIYINGILSATEIATTNLSGNDTSFFLGYTNNNWTGYLDEVFVYNRAITQAEVSQLYNLK